MNETLEEYLYNQTHTEVSRRAIDNNFSFILEPTNVRWIKESPYKHL